MFCLKRKEKIATKLLRPPRKKLNFNCSFVCYLTHRMDNAFFFTSLPSPQPTCESASPTEKKVKCDIKLTGSIILHFTLWSLLYAAVTGRTTCLSCLYVYMVLKPVLFAVMHTHYRRKKKKSMQIPLMPYLLTTPLMLMLMQMLTLMSSKAPFNAYEFFTPQKHQSMLPPFNSLSE